jgi:hypothetical protein
MNWVRGCASREPSRPRNRVDEAPRDRVRTIRLALELNGIGTMPDTNSQPGGFERPQSERAARVRHG